MFLSPYKFFHRVNLEGVPKFLERVIFAKAESLLQSGGGGQTQLACGLRLTLFAKGGEVKSQMGLEVFHCSLHVVS